MAKAKKKVEPVIEKAPDEITGRLRRITPLIFKLYSVISISARSKIANGFLREGVTYSLTVGAIPYDPETDPVPRIYAHADYSAEVDDFTRSYYKTATSPRELLEDFEYIGVNGSWMNKISAEGKKEESPVSKVKFEEWWGGLKELWKERKEMYDEALARLEKA